MNKLRKPSLSPSWQDALNRKMEKHYPRVIENWSLVDAWKQDGWNDGTTTIFGVYQSGVKYRMCVFPPYGRPSSTPANPIFEHTGWAGPDTEGRE